MGWLVVTNHFYYKGVFMKKSIIVFILSFVLTNVSMFAHEEYSAFDDTIRLEIWAEHNNGVGMRITNNESGSVHEYYFDIETLIQDWIMGSLYDVHASNQWGHFNPGQIWGTSFSGYSLLDVIHRVRQMLIDGW